MNHYHVPHLSNPARVHNARATRRLLVWFEDGDLLLHDKVEEPVRLRLHDIVEVRMNYTPAVHTQRVQRGPHRVCSLKMADGKRYRIRAELDKGDAEDEYKNLMLALHSELGRLQRPPVYVTGIQRWAYLSMMIGVGVLFGAIEVGMILLSLFGPKEKAGMGILFFLGIGVIAGYFLWKIKTTLGSKPYDPEQLHHTMLV